MPSDAHEIIAIIFDGANPVDTWDNYVVPVQITITGTNSSLTGRVVGTGVNNQQHKLSYTVLYR